MRVAALVVALLVSSCGLILDTDPPDPDEAAGTPCVSHSQCDDDPNDESVGYCSANGRCARAADTSPFERNPCVDVLWDADHWYPATPSTVGGDWGELPVNGCRPALLVCDASGARRATCESVRTELSCSFFMCSMQDGETCVIDDERATDPDGDGWAGTVDGEAAMCGTMPADCDETSEEAYDRHPLAGYHYNRVDYDCDGRIEVWPPANHHTGNCTRIPAPSGIDCLQTPQACCQGSGWERTWSSTPSPEDNYYVGLYHLCLPVSADRCEALAVHLKAAYR